MVDGGLKCLSPDGDRQPTDKEVFQGIKNFGGERQFGKLLTDLKIKQPRICLYSTRTTFVTALQRVTNSDTLIQNVIGHVGNAKMLRHYKSRAELNDMAEAMNAIRY